MKENKPYLCMKDTKNQTSFSQATRKLKLYSIEAFFSLHKMKFETGKNKLIISIYQNKQNSPKTNNHCGPTHFTTNVSNRQKHVCF